VVTGTAGTAEVTGSLGGGSLRTCLLLAVPLWLEVARGCSPDELAGMADESAGILAGDGALPGPGAAPADAARAASHLARVIAIAALAPGGVTFAGMHWCDDSHPDCPDGGQRCRP
jgi:hypothetical protein